MNKSKSKLVMEQTWVRVRNVRLFWSSSSFSSTFGLKSKVRDVRSSEIPKFGCSKFEFLEFVPFRSILGQKYCTETEASFTIFLPHKLFICSKLPENKNQHF